MTRLASWLTSPELEPPKKVSLSDAVKTACDEDGMWRGSALYLYHKDGWTIFEDLSGHFGSIPGKTWLAFANTEEFVFAGYNDAIGYGELIIIQNGSVRREFLFDANDRDANVNHGMIEGSPIEPLQTWIQPAQFVDDDDLVFSEHGLLWLHRTP